MTTLGWGRKVAPAFRDRMRAIADGLETDPNWLIACMAFESACTFSASLKNGAGSCAVGLIQFMPQTAGQLHTTTAKLAAMTALAQLDYVDLYFRPCAARCTTSAMSICRSCGRTRSASPTATSCSPRAARIRRCILETAGSTSTIVATITLFAAGGVIATAEQLEDAVRGAAQLIYNQTLSTTVPALVADARAIAEAVIPPPVAAAA